MEKDGERIPAAKNVEGEEAKKARRKHVFDSLHKEVELVEYATIETGQRRKKTPRAESKIRTKKRRLLEENDVVQHALLGDDNRQRMRGSRRALDESVIASSRIFGKDDKESDDEEETEDVDEMVTDMEPDAPEVEGDDEGDDEEVDTDVELEDAEIIDDEVDAATTPGKQSKSSNSTLKKSHPSTKRQKRLMFQMKNFTSARMAERHGAALGAHARGQSMDAVKKLELVAADAPAAPQVYSSLGMVYESLLSESRKQAQEGEQREESHEKQLDLAKKAYGSYHVAAVLCKKDFSLWVRAGDTAKEIADLFGEVMVDAQDNERLEEFREEKKKWLEEAKKDYNTADNLKPPGIDVPAKLTSVHMDLGNLSEALTVLTDLKNSAAVMSDSTGGVRQRTEFESSYKVWLLYADLMLRIGYECTRWNKGIQANANYMFRRWLRKWSRTFDWEERRLHALALALEAAAGTRACEHLIQWTKKRASRRAEDWRVLDDERRWHLDSYEFLENTMYPRTSDLQAGDAEEKEDEKESDGTDDVGETTQPSLGAAEPIESPFEQSRASLLAENRSELDVFDNETKKVALPPGSSAERGRQDARSALISSQRKAVVDLIGEFHQRQAAGFASKPSATRTIATVPLPIAASCATVCSIASELMKHCLKFDLFQGGRLVGEAVSAYLKERGEVLEKRLEANRTFTQRQQSTEESVLLHFEAYDEVGVDESDEEADKPYLSDDEIIMESSNESVIPTLKRGILPPELQFLFALSLFGEGGRAFLARKCVMAVEAIEFEDVDTLSSDLIDNDVVKDLEWHSFRNETTQPLRKTAAFALAVEVLRKANLEKAQFDVMAPLLNRHLDDLQANGQMRRLFLSDKDLSDQAISMKSEVAKLILTSVRIEMQSAVRNQDQLTPEMVSSVLERVTLLFDKFWKVDANGSIPSVCIEGLSLLANTCEASSIANAGDDELAMTVLGKLLNVLSVLCGTTIPHPLEAENVHAETSAAKWSEFPIKTDWLNEQRAKVSGRVFNLAVGCSVSSFSGWEADEFTLDLIKRSKRHNFGVDIHGQRVSGYLLPSTGAELAEQWKTIGNLLPHLPSFDFGAKLKAAKSAPWYREMMYHVDDNCEEAASNGEKDGLSALLALSRLCLKVAMEMESEPKKDALIKLAMSIVLPVSEFALDAYLWDATIGKAGIAQQGTTYDWNKLARSVVEKQQDGYEPPRRPPPKEPERTVPSLPSIISIPASVLLAQWNAGRVDSETKNIAEAKSLMRRVDIATKQLRACYSESAIQKSCIQVALALLELVVKDYCFNPFLCLIQAAMFASHGAKGGNSDEQFKEGLPKEKECTPEDALVIIGRADCLQALYFPDEAIYLCSYVARVCRRRRDRQGDDLSWSSQWRVIGICLYNLSVSIRKTRAFCNENRPEYWEKSVVEELQRGRADAIALKQTLPEDNILAVVDEGGENESNQEDNFEHGDDDENGNFGDFEDGNVLGGDDQGFASLFHQNDAMPAHGMLSSNTQDGAFSSNADEFPPSSGDDEQEIVEV